MTSAVSQQATQAGLEDVARGLYETMAMIRAFEERAGELFAAGELPGFIHLSIGQEAVAAGVMAALHDGDVIATTHRGHGHCLARGAEPRRMFSELYGKAEGYSRGVGGSMHIADIKRGILGANGIVGASIVLATGAAFAFQVLTQPRVAVAFFGDGAVAEGAFHEALNIAALWRLPVLYVCENNGYAEMTPQAVHVSGGGISERATPYGISSIKVDGTDALAVYRVASEALAQCRAAGGPILIEALTERWHGHFEGDPQKYRPAAELATARQRDPISRLAAWLIEHQLCGREWCDSVPQRAHARMESDAREAKAGSDPVFTSLLSQTYCEGDRRG